ncbi:hypothetical protein [Pseudoalteromonas byunsanensis]|uniref:Thioredoxin domain-containing protein n=1 Tax=Pseudoalteromonas byunsanensis TaxID=327939 RepID=A0A1S1N6U5_9GAMM|nr:hypothetical protein [Pseudoalteromonas byunsanensis]OHU96955.1 hypothetical protein BIW53_03615 [Pseudoalteromonas byunsanensis]
MTRDLILIAFLLLSCASKATSDDTYELVFIDIWGEYIPPSSLPKSKYPRHFMQLDMNVTQSDIEKFVNTHPQYQSLQIDKNNTLGIRYGVRSTPTIVQIKRGKMVDKAILATPPSLPNDEHKAIEAQHLLLYSLSGRQHDFKADSTKTRLILFSDALCPARHLPHCEHKAMQHNEISPPDTMEKLTVIKPFYVSLEDVQSYQKRLRVNHPVLFDQHNALFRRYGIKSLPYWLILDKDHQVIYRGAMAPEQTLLRTYSSSHSD